MKKIVLFLLLLLLCSCNKEDALKTHDLMVNVYDGYSDMPSYGQVLASPSYTYLFPDNAKAIDTLKSTVSVMDSAVITFVDGTVAKPLYQSTAGTGINVFRFLPDGHYIVWISYRSSIGGVYSSSKQLSVTENTASLLTLNPLLDCTLSGGYQLWNEK